MSEKPTDPMDHFSLPIRVEYTAIAKKFYFEPRENPQKPGRSLRVIFDTRFPTVESFRPEYIYSVTFDKSGNQAGNHYHLKKNELFFPLKGDFEVHMERISDQEKEVILLSSANHETLFVRKEIAHKVIAKSDGAVLLVIATSPNVEGDEFHYDLG